MIDKTTLKKIKDIIDLNYNALLLSVVGPEVLTEGDLQTLRDAGYSVEDAGSLLSTVYYHNVLNSLTDKHQPTTIEAAKEQQVLKPERPKHLQAEQHLNEGFAQAVERLKADVQQHTDAILREYNLSERHGEAAGGLIEQAIKESSTVKTKQLLRDMAEDADRNWSRVAITETSNAIGLGSVDRVLEMSGDTPADEVYVYRLAVEDAATCSACKRFYLDPDGSPAVYRLSTLLGNGTNYGLKTQAWKPVAGASHPNERCSGVVELRRGWRVLPGGEVEFIGNTAWAPYILKKLRS